jgi:predicted ribosomally synthesized peptide with nif11-like leader
VAIEDAVRFLVLASTDAALKSRLDRSTTPSSLVALAKEHAFSFTVDELAQVLAAEDGELSDQSLEQVSGGLTPMDPGALVQYALRESYLQNVEDLKYYAEKVKYYNSMKGAIRQSLGGWPP